MKKPEDGDIDALVRSVRNADPNSPLIFNCHAGQGRTTTAMVLTSLLRQPGSDVLKDPNLRDDIKEQCGHDPREYRPALRAIKDSQKLVEGSQQQADEIIGKYNQVVDLKKSVQESRDAAASKATDAARERALDYLERYHTIVSVGAYARDPQGLSYSQWKAAHPEVQARLELTRVTNR